MSEGTVLAGVAVAIYGLFVLAVLAMAVRAGQDVLARLAEGEGDAEGD